MLKNNHITVILLSVICGILGYIAAEIKQNSNEQKTAVQTVEKMLEEVKKQTAEIKTEPDEKIIDGGYIKGLIPPSYPTESVENEEEGQVIVQAVVNKDGKTSSVQVIQSSGSPYLDNAALSAAESEKFTPKKENGNFIKTKFYLRYSFKLTN